MQNYAKWLDVEWRFSTRYTPSTNGRMSGPQSGLLFFEKCTIFTLPIIVTPFVLFCSIFDLFCIIIFTAEIAFRRRLIFSKENTKKLS